MIDEISRIKKFYLVCGYGEIAREVAAKLKYHHKRIVIIDEDEQNIKEAKSAGYKALQLNPANVDSYKKLNIDIDTQVKAVLCLVEDDVLNVYTALTVRSFNKNINILSILMHDSNRKKLQFAGINQIIYPQELVGMITSELAGKPVAFEVIHELRSENSLVKIDELSVTQRVVENFTRVGDLGNIRYRVVLLGLYSARRDRFFFNPLDDMLLESGDYLLVIGYKVFIKEFEKHLHTSMKYE
jgi:voltage-gated potassium channel